jgi:uncharacterized protein (TIGR02217 family)
MSNAIFPNTFAGLEWNTTREPIWSTSKRSSVSGRAFHIANFSYPRYRYKLSYSVLQQRAAFTELTQLAGFFNARQGDFDTFLFTDPNDNAAAAQTIGSGNAVATQFQLVRSFGSYIEPVYDVNGTAQIFVNGVLKTLTTDYTISASGVVTFVAAPGAGLAITWTGSFYRRVRFEKSSAEFTQFLKNLWSLKSLELVSYKP